MTTRRYDLNTGIETSDTPTVTDPSSSTDIMSKGYADKTYAARQYWGHAVADTTALKAIGTTGDAQRYDQQIVLKDDDNTLWKFDAASSATEDGTTVIAPNTGTGRWLICSGGTGGATAGASSLELLQYKAEAEGFGIATREFDNAVVNSSRDIPLHTYFTGYLMENYTSGSSSMKIVWNPLTLNSSDKNYDATTNWGVFAAGATLTASATPTPKVGSNVLKFDKNNTGVSAAIRYSYGSSIGSVGGNTRLWFWLYLPSITDLSKISVLIAQDSGGSNYAAFEKTTDYAGSALAVGWNLMFIDLAGTPSATGGTGWTPSQLFYWFYVYVFTGSAATTYTGIAVDAIYFSHKDIADVNFNGVELTGFDTSNKNNFIIDVSNTRYDGPVTLDATVAQNYTAGISNADAARFKRSTLTWSTGGFIGFDSTLSSGTISTQQEVRLIKQFRESLSGNLSGFVDMYTPQVYKVTSVGGSTIAVEDPANTIANLKNGDEIHIFETIRNAGEITFAHRATRSMTADATHSSGTSTLTVSPTSIAVGDYVVKQNLDVKASLVAKAADESFSAMSYDTSPNGVQLINQGRAVPNPAYLIGMYDLGNANETLAKRDRSGMGYDLTKVGSPNLTDTFSRGRFSYSGITASNYLRGSAGTQAIYNADAGRETIQVSLWFYFDAINASGRHLVNCFTYNGATDYRGWTIEVGGTTAALYLNYWNSSATPSAQAITSAMTAGTWNHCVIQVKGTVTQNVYLNGVKFTTTAGAISGAVSTTAFYFGARQASTTVDSSIDSAALNMKMADALVWRGGPLLTDAQVSALYNAGAPVPTGFFPVLRNEYELTGQSGQKLSMKATLSRTTTAVSPAILDLGAIKQ